MNSLVLDVPAMYADHHVQEVRKILLEMPGVEEVNASSAFRVVEIDFDSGRVTEDALRKALDETGYLGGLNVPEESGKPAFSGEDNGELYYRHSTAREKLADTSFEQTVPSCGRPLWPCPGMNRSEKIED